MKKNHLARTMNLKSRESGWFMMSWNSLKTNKYESAMNRLQTCKILDTSLEPKVQ